MPRKLTWGTPGRSERYVRPRRAFTWVWPALLLLVGVAGAWFAAEALGFRGALSPGAVSRRHASYDARCQECHLPRGGGAADVRCQRCHDPGSGGRLTLAAHVYSGSLDPAKAESAGEAPCAHCHVEHRGAAADLTHVAQAQCVGCHADPRRVELPLRRFAAHPEFRVLRDGSRQATGLVYSHLTHVTRGRGKREGYLVLDRNRRARGVTTPAETCAECHLREAAGAGFEPLDFDAHCVDCHRADVNKMEPVSAAQVVPFETLALDERLVAGWAVRAEDFEREGGLLAKLRVHHEDEWIVFNLRKLRRELDPEGFAAERGALLTRRAQLERRLVLARPLAAEDTAALDERARAVGRELEYVEERLVRPAQAREPLGGLARIEEIGSAAGSAGEDGTRAQAQALAQQARRLLAAPPGAGPLPPDEFETRRVELLRLLDVVERAAPERRAQADELRRRLAALRPGDASADLLRRAREQRRTSLERLDDERALRRSGTAPPAETLLRHEIRALERALGDTERRLAQLDAVGAPDGPLDDAARAARRETVAALSAGCRYCHEISPEGAFAPVAAAEPVLWRAAFRHREHLTHGEACTSCHAGTRGGAEFSIETAARASALNFRGVDSCRACHRAGQATQVCLDCHDYHPREAP